MGANIVREARRIEKVEYFLVFAWAHDHNAGFSFDCNVEGEVDYDSMSPYAQANYDGCVSGVFDVVRMGVREHRWTVVEPAEAECLCGDGIILHDPMLNRCGHCGRLYNGWGQSLKPVEQWGEETGEQPSDIFLDYDPEDVR